MADQTEQDRQALRAQAAELAQRIGELEARVGAASSPRDEIALRRLLDPLYRQQSELQVSLARLDQGDERLAQKPVANPDAAQAEAIRRQMLEAERDERQRNAAAGRGYLSDAQVAAVAHLGTADALAGERARAAAEQQARASDLAAGTLAVKQAQAAFEQRQRSLEDDLAQGRLSLAQAVQAANAAHQQVMDAVAQRDAAERALHDRAVEANQSGALAETGRRDRADEALAAQREAELGRHNLANEAATTRGQDLDFAQRFASTATQSALGALERGYTTPAYEAWIGHLYGGDLQAAAPAVQPYWFDPVAYEQAAHRAAAEALAGLSPAARAHLDSAAAAPTVGGPQPPPPADGSTVGAFVAPSSGQAERVPTATGPGPLLG